MEADHSGSLDPGAPITKNIAHDQVARYRQETLLFPRNPMDLVVDHAIANNTAMAKDFHMVPCQKVSVLLETCYHHLSSKKRFVADRPDKYSSVGQ